MFLREHEKSLRQQCSWLDQKKSVMFRAESLFFRNDAEKISYFQSWLSIVQNSSESIWRSRITSQVLLPNHNLEGGRNCMWRITSKWISGIESKAVPSSSSILVTLCFGRFWFGLYSYSRVTLTCYSFDVLGVLDLILFWYSRSLSLFFCVGDNILIHFGKSA